MAPSRKARATKATSSPKLPRAVWHQAHANLHSPYNRTTVVLVGCGGNGARMLLRVAELDRTLRALGAPGLDVHVYDGDDVSEANLARQPFSFSDVGLKKAVVLVHRINLTYGAAYHAHPVYFEADTRFSGRSPDLVISCVDTRAARRTIAEVLGQSWGVRYWMDLGNDVRTGQVVLGTLGEHAVPLPTCVELWPEIADPDLDADGGPSCSSAEALRRQDLFIHDVLCAHAGNLLWRLFRDGCIRHHGAFCDLETGVATPIPILDRTVVT